MIDRVRGIMSITHEYNTSIAGPISFNLEPKIKRLKKTISLKKRSGKAN